MMIRKTTLLSLLLSLALMAVGQTRHIDRPSIEGATSFAVITDTKTYEKCREQIALYKQTIENEGLPVFVVADEWSKPEAVREQLRQLYEEHSLEGCVLVGDVPVAMITKAQHLTTAFKMNERTYPLFDCSVPSDRYYDDFDLVFDRLDEPSQGLLHYFAMSPHSPQYIECDIYSARLKPQKSNGDPYAQIAAYLEKAVREHRSGNELDQFLSFTGSGSHSNSLVAWRSEQQVVREQFGDRFSHRNAARFSRFTMEPYMKYDAIRDLRRKDLDFMIFHQHGDYFRMYISGDPFTTSTDEHIEQMEVRLRSLAARSGESAKKLADEWGLDSTWYANYDSPEMVEKDSLLDLRTGIILEEINEIRPNARMVFFDACFNGDFRNDDFIAGKFIFSEGDCVIGWANSVNVLQDKTSYDLMGLLGYGVRIGVWAKHINILESHIHGDPTLFFASKEGRELDLNRNYLRKDHDYWTAMLDHRLPDVQSLAMIRLLEEDYEGISQVLLDKYMSSPYATVRGTAMMLSERLDDENYKKILMKASTDSFEFTRRLAVTRMGQKGDEDFIPLLIDSYINDHNSARVMFQNTFALASFDRDKVIEAINSRFDSSTMYDAARMKEDIMRYVDTRTEDGYPSKRKDFVDREETRWRPFYITALKNQPLHQYVDEFTTILADETEPETIRVLMAEALAWFELSVHKQKIVSTCASLLERGGMSEELEREVRRAHSRLTSKK